MDKALIEGQTVTQNSQSKKQILIDLLSSKIIDVGDKLGTADVVLSDQQLIFPGFIDIHVHSRDDGTDKETHKEDLNTLSEAALNGGVVAVMDMPNNFRAPVNDQIYSERLNHCQGRKISIVPYAGIGPASKPLEQTVPYKLYIGHSVGDLFFASFLELERVVSQYRGCAISFHCEDASIIEQSKMYNTHETRRPVEAELVGIKQAIELTKRYDLEATVCHVSTLEGMKLCLQARDDGLKIKTEVAPHHLYFSEEDITNANRKLLQVNPPVRTLQDKEGLLELVRQGQVDFLATDHAPHLMSEKMKGISGLPHLDSYGLFVSWLIKEAGVDPTVVARMCAYNPGKVINRYQEKKYGMIEKGFEAIFSVIDFSKTTILTTENIKSKCSWTPFDGVEFPGKVGILKRDTHNEKCNFD